MRTFFFFLLLAAVGVVGWYFYEGDQAPTVASVQKQYERLHRSVSNYLLSANLKPFVPPNPLPRKENWTWEATNGKTYTQVRIVKVEADCVTILDSDGGARVAISTLPADIQRQLNYDPDQARLAAEARSEEMNQSKEELTAEQRFHQAQVNQTQIAVKPGEPLETKPDPVAPAPAVAVAPQPVNNDPTNPRNFELNYLQGQYDAYMAKADADQKAYDAETLPTLNGVQRPSVSKDAEADRRVAAHIMKKIEYLKKQQTK